MTQFTKITSFVQFFKNLHIPRTIHNMQYIYSNKPIVYAIKCDVDHMVYIGSTLVPGRRFDNHLVTGTRSNSKLQIAISKYGLSQFTAYVLEVVDMPAHWSYKQQIKVLHKVEQKHMNLFPKEQLYNTISSSRDIL